jgi:dephospho-CoA kinase
MHLMSGTTIVVAVSDPKVQMDRLRARDPHLSEEDASNRVLSQGDVREKADRCAARGLGRGVVVWNDSDQEQLKNEVDKVLDQIRSQSPLWWTWLCLLFPPAGISSAAWSMFRNWQLDNAWQKKKEAEKAKL